MEEKKEVGEEERSHRVRNKTPQNPTGCTEINFCRRSVTEKRPEFKPSHRYADAPNPQSVFETKTCSVIGVQHLWHMDLEHAVKAVATRVEGNIMIGALHDAGTPL